MYHVYVIQSKKDKNLYIGLTNNLEKRLMEHNQGLNKSTKYRAPFELVYCESYVSAEDARNREKKLKGFKNSYTELKKRIINSLKSKSGGGQKGVSLYLALMVMTILLAIAFGLSTIFLGQSKMIKEMGNSVIAFYAADTGIEEVLINRTDPVDIPETQLLNGASYRVVVTVGGVGTCSSDNNYCIKSIGTYQEIKRAIEIEY